MDKDSKKIITNKAVLEVKAALKKLESSKKLFLEVGEDLTAISLNECIECIKQKLSNIDSLIKVVKSEGKKSKNLVLQHPLQDYFHDLWMELFPDYGKFTSRDFKSLKELLLNLDNRANKLFIRRIIENYKNSTAAWCNPKLVHVLARNFRRFVDGPVRDFGIQKADRTSGGSNNSVLDGIYIPDAR